MQNLILLLLCLTCSFCTNTNNENNPPTTDTLQTAENNTTSTPDENSVDGCYVLILKRDTMVLHLESSEKISGKLTFDNYEKDGSTGTVKGTKEGNIIKLLYSFASEGMNSVMDVYFKVDGDKLIRGIGDMQTKGDTAYFTNPAAITFTDTNVFQKTDCENVPLKYRQ